MFFSETKFPVPPTLPPVPESQVGPAHLCLSFSLCTHSSFALWVSLRDLWCHLISTPKATVSPVLVCLGTLLSPSVKSCLGADSWLMVVFLFSTLNTIPLLSEFHCVWWEQWVAHLTGGFPVSDIIFLLLLSRCCLCLWHSAVVGEEPVFCTRR